MTGTFFCINCGETKRDDLLGSLTAGGRKICVSCDAKRRKRDADRERVIFVGLKGEQITGLDKENNAKRRNAKRYADGILPPFAMT